MDKIREPSVAGYFYPETKEKLLKAIESFIPVRPLKEKHISAVCPHAGYVFSGATAGKVYSEIDMPGSVILLGPNHTGYGEPYAVESSDSWVTPLGKIDMDRDLSEKLVKRSRYLEPDCVAHANEHSLEVQVPFIQFLNPVSRIVPIALSGYVDNPAWGEIGESIADIVREEKGKDVMIIASSDMTHYESEETARENDSYAIEAILALDEDLLIERIAEKNISMCGYGPVITAIIASKELGAKEGRLIDYTTSGRVNRDYSQVVGYAGITIK